MRAQLPFSVIGGFLGAGKTTLLNQLIRRPRLPRLAVLVNDFGSIAVDAALVAAHDGDTVELNNGCICCSIGNDLGRCLSDLLDRDSRPEHIVVEASGVSNPARIMDIARLSSELYCAGVVVVVDAGGLCDQLADDWIADTVITQLRSADLLLLNKIETVDFDLHEAALERLAREFIDLPVTDDVQQVWRVFAEANPLNVDSVLQSPWNNIFQVRNIETERSIDRDRLRQWLRRRQDVYRIKGWARMANGERVLVQAAGHRISWSDAVADTGATRIVVIGREGLPDCDDIIEAITTGP